MGLEGFKPLECVGTPEEALAAFALIANRPEYQTSVIVQMVKAECALPSQKEIEELSKPVYDYATSDFNQALLTRVGICV